LQADPIGLDGGMNIYGYTQNNSLRFFDSNGLLTLDNSCNWLQQDKLKKAETKIREELGKSDKDCCIPPKYNKLLLKKLDEVKIECGRAGSGACANADKPGAIIFGATPFKPLPREKFCLDCLAAILYHELLHKLGLPNHDYRNIPPKDDMIDKRTTECVKNLCENATE
jgi:hypothetical protein